MSNYSSIYSIVIKRCFRTLNLKFLKFFSKKETLNNNTRVSFLITIFNFHLTML